jgi:hypothetical protein
MFAGASGGKLALPVLLVDVDGDCAKAAAGSTAAHIKARANARKQFKA